MRLSLAQYLKHRHWNTTGKNVQINLQPLLFKYLTQQVSSIILRSHFDHVFYSLLLPLHYRAPQALTFNCSSITHFHLSAFPTASHPILTSVKHNRTCLLSLQGQMCQSLNLKCPESITHLTLKCQFPGNSHMTTPCSWNTTLLETQ